MNCCICGKLCRTQLIPDYFKFWRPLAVIFRFKREGYTILAFLCPKDYQWTIDHEDIAKAMIFSKVQAGEENDSEGD